VLTSVSIFVSGDLAGYREGMQLRYNYRLDPRPRHRVALGKAFGCARVVYNDGLRARQQAPEAGLPYVTDAELSARLTAAKAAPGRAWLGEVSAVILQQALADLNATEPVIGVDLGLQHFAVLSDGRKITSPRFVRRAENKLRRAQRSLSRKEKGSRNRDKARVKVARAHARVADARQDFHHQLSTALIRDNQAIAVEDLCVTGLARTRLAKSVHDAGWSAFVGMLEYKARLYGRELRRIGRFEPTSQTCLACGVKDGPKPLHVREWQCGACAVWLDRDINAAVNVAKAAGLAVTACGAQVRPGLALAQRGEAGTHPKSRPNAARQAGFSALQGEVEVKRRTSPPTCAAPNSARATRWDSSLPSPTRVSGPAPWTVTPGSVSRASVTTRCPRTPSGARPSSTGTPAAS
jgi:IS605 OrfB family transposase